MAWYESGTSGIDCNPNKEVLKTENPQLSIILLAYYSGEKVRIAFEKLNEIMRLENIPFELVVINDGSKDGNQTRMVAQELAENYPEVRYFELSRNYTSHYATFAGLSVCNGGCAVVIPDDEQQPYETLVKAYRLWERGEKIVLFVRSSRNDPKLSKWFSNSFYWFLNKTTDFEYPKYGLDTWFIDREVIDLLNTRISPRNTTTITEILRLGFDPKLMFYERIQSTQSKSRWSFKKKMKLASDWFFSTSRFPIKLVEHIHDYVLYLH